MRPEIAKTVESAYKGGYKNFRRWSSDRATPSTTAKMLSPISEKE